MKQYVPNTNNKSAKMSRKFDKGSDSMLGIGEDKIIEIVIDNIAPIP